MKEHGHFRIGAAKWRPPFIREIRARAEADGILQATHSLLERDNVTVTPKGHVAAVKDHSGGILFVGNHDKQFEFVALMSFLGQIDRTNMKNVVKFYVRNQIDWALGKSGTDIVLPVYPRLLATDRKNKLNLELGSRILFRRSLQSTEESARHNEQTLDASAAELSSGGSVNIYPCGRIANNMKKPWRSGVGRILTRLAETERDDVLVVPYHANNINRVRLLGAVALQGKGPLPRPQDICIEFGQSAKASDIINRLPDSDKDNAAAVTEVIRQQYLTRLT